MPASISSPPRALDGRTVAILVSDLFEEAELSGPRRALVAAGARAVVISDQPGPLRALQQEKLAGSVEVDLPLARARPEDYDALVLPGGVMNADALRMVREAHAFVRAIDEAKKPIAVICHGPWLLISAGLMKGRTLTSWPSLQDDIRNAGGRWLDQALVRDGHWISSRKPADLPAFNAALIEALRADQEAPAISVGT